MEYNIWYGKSLFHQTHIIFIAALAFILTGCNLLTDEENTELSTEEYHKTETDFSDQYMESTSSLYCHDFYNMYDKLEYKSSDVYSHHVYHNEMDGLSIYVREPSGIESGSEKWYGGENITVYITDYDYHILYEDSFSKSNGTIEYYVADGSIYKIATYGNDNSVMIMWDYYCGGQQPISVLEKSGSVWINCKETQDFSDLNNKLQVLNNIKENGECVIRCGNESYDLGDVNQEYDPFYSMIEGLNLGYFIPDRNSTANTIKNLQDYVDGKEIPQEFKEIEESANELFEGNYVEKMWVLLPSDVEIYLQTDDAVYEKVSAGIMALMNNQAESLEITMGGNAVDGIIQQKKSITLSLIEPDDIDNYYKLKISCSQDAKINQEAVDGIASFILYESEEIKEVSYISEEIHDGQSQNYVLLHSITDEIGYRYFDYIGLEYLQPGASFCYQPGNVFSGKDILGKGKDFCESILAGINMNRIVRIEKMS